MKLADWKVYAPLNAYNPNPIGIASGLLPSKPNVSDGKPSDYEDTLLALGFSYKK